MERLDDIIKRYQQLVSMHRGAGVQSAAYEEFRKHYLPRSMSLYEKLCKQAEFLGIKPDAKTAERLSRILEEAHLQATPTGVYSAAILYPGLLILTGLLLSIIIFQDVTSFILPFLLIYAILVGVFLKLPEQYAYMMRLRATNQMVQAVFYVVSFMRHTSNLELALEFAADRIAPPLALDFKKILWDTAAGRYETVKEALNAYLDRWRETNLEFVEAFHLIEGSLVETSEERRITLLDKALNTMLEETYEKMLHYAHSLKGPVNMLYMLGIILPILSLVILPLVGSMMTSESLTPSKLSYLIFLFYNILLPLFVYTQARAVLNTRPTGYGENDISDEHPELKRYQQVNIFGITLSPVSLLVGMLILSSLITLFPILLGMTATLRGDEVVLPLPDPELIPNTDFRLWGYKLATCKGAAVCPPHIVGPYGIGALTLGIIGIILTGIGLAVYYLLRYAKLYQLREEGKKLEKEVASALFQLGSRIGDGIPAELAFEKAAETLRGTTAGEFFMLVAMNIRRLGMSVQQAIFDPERGALRHFPNPLIESSMRVLTESLKKGPLVASQALLNIAEYIRQIHRVNERLRDLLADVIADMKQQVNFLAPAIAGIVVGITAMIMTILTQLTHLFKQFSQLSGVSMDAAAGAAGNIESFKTLVTMFGDGVPPYYFQLIVGLYILQITFILTILINGVENGADPLAERYLLGKHYLRVSILYGLIALFTSIAFSMIAANVISGLVGA